MISIAGLLEAADLAQKASLAASGKVAAALTAALRVKLKVGDEINLLDRKGRPYLYSVKTTRGNDRGTKRFRIDTVPTVSFNPDFPEATSWSCEAMPISEKTGLPMSGRVHGANSGEGVRLVGSLIYVPVDLEGDAYNEYCAHALIEFVTSSETGKA